jgi:hypothetical protein
MTFFFVTKALGKKATTIVLVKAFQPILIPTITANYPSVSIPFKSPFYIMLFINIVHNYSIPVNCTYCRDEINESTETDMSSLAPHKNPINTK